MDLVTIAYILLMIGFGIFMTLPLHKSMTLFWLSWVFVGISVILVLLVGFGVI